MRRMFDVNIWKENRRKKSEHDWTCFVPHVNNNLSNGFDDRTLFLYF